MNRRELKSLLLRWRQCPDLDAPDILDAILDNYFLTHSPKVLAKDLGGLYINVYPHYICTRLAFSYQQARQFCDDSPLVKTIKIIPKGGLPATEGKS